MERQKFEDLWKESFKDAEVSPSENLWTNIELDLEKADGKKMKRRVLFFKLLAAASVAFAMTFASGVYYLNKQDTNAQLANTNTSVTNSNDNSQEKTSPSSQTAGKDGDQSTNPRRASVPNKSNDASIAAKSDKEGGNKNTHDGENNREPDHLALLVSNEEAPKELKDQLIQSGPGDYDLLSTRGKLPAMVILRKPSIQVSVQPEADPVALMLARLNDDEKKYVEEKRNSKERTNENVWTSVGFAAGSFNTVTSGNSSLMMQNTQSQSIDSYARGNSIIHDQSSASGIAYTVGLSLGGKLSKRWVLQGGLNYQTQSSDYTTNAVVSSADYMTYKLASINELNNSGKTGDSHLVNTASYNVNSNLEYLSVPLQAGYLIINRDFGLQLNAGISTDLFLRNTLTPEEGSLEKTTQSNGDDSPYRPVNFSGLVGTELSYRFGQHYRVALNPGLRYPFSSIYKSDITLSAMPLTFDVGLRFRYIFN